MANKKPIIERAADALRVFLKDKPELNKLLGGKVENDPEFLKLAIRMSIDDWNTTPPPIAFVTLESHPSQYLLIYGASIQALISAGIWHSRERMPSSDGGTSADDHAKFSEYQGWLRSIYNDYELKKLNLKKAINISNAYGGFFSEYAGFSRKTEGLF